MLFFPRLQSLSSACLDPLVLSRPRQSIADLLGNDKHKDMLKIRITDYWNQAIVHHGLEFEEKTQLFGYLCDLRAIGSHSLEGEAFDRILVMRVGVLQSSWTIFSQNVGANKSAVTLNL